MARAIAGQDHAAEPVAERATAHSPNQDTFGHELGQIGQGRIHVFQTPQEPQLVYPLLNKRHAKYRIQKNFILYFPSSSASCWRQKGLPESAGTRRLNLANF
jgi:hypothetical protein